MNKADNLLAMLRQVPTGKSAQRNGAHQVAVAKDSGAKADHFRDQLRMLAKGMKAESADGNSGLGKNVAPDQGEEIAAHEADTGDEKPIRTKDRSGRAGDASHHMTGESVAALTDWRGPDAALSAVLARLNQANVPAGQEEDPAPRTAHSISRGAEDGMIPDLDTPVELSTSTGNAEPRFSVSVSTTETRIAPAVKVAVREQETHFAPVQQATVLQKIVDQLAADLSPAAATQAGTGVADVSQPDILRTADKPLRMLTLELDPPNLGAVTVRMRMAGDSVEVRLTADKVETMHMLQKERGALSEAMQSAGYKFDIAAIDEGSTGDAGLGANQQQSQQDQKQSQQSFAGSQFESGASGRQPGEAQSGARQHRQAHDQLVEPTERPQAKDAVRDRNGGAVYL